MDFLGKNRSLPKVCKIFGSEMSPGPIRTKVILGGGAE